ncbi:MAG: type VI secretion system ATPase TssH [Planctomycetes bacterium]|nr:type VI secretion system ATPase TssH [Planctomycetota bacterium]MCW8135170.1 type VI secretion system ATPase TssH [Planctomycetota bacterium]
MAEVDLKALIGRLNRFSTRALEAAAGNCVSRTNYEVTVEHMLQALIEDPSADFNQVFQKFNIDHGRVLKTLTRDLDQLKTGNSGRPVFSPTLTHWIQTAWLIASIDHGLAEIRSANLLQALLDSPSRLAAGDYIDLLAEIPKAELKKNFHQIVDGSTETAAGAAKASGTAGAAGAEPSKDGTALQRFCQNFTERARQGKLDPVFGRDREIRQMVDILARRRKNNPICVGDPGVGKSAVVEGLALRIIEGDVPEMLRNVELVGLDVGLLQAGASVKGEFENRLKGVIEEIKGSPKPIILFIDEAHTLIGAGGAAGTGDAGQLLKPALARGELRTIAATTWSEYKKYFEKDAALARRFQLVKLDEPSPELTTVMLRGLRANYEKSHGVVIRDEALVAAAEMGSRYIAGRQQPDKGIDLVDTAAARVKVAFLAKPAELQDLERSIETDKRTLGALKRDADTGGHNDPEQIAEIEQRIKDTEGKAEAFRKRWLGEREQAHKVVAVRTKLNDLLEPKKPGESKKQEAGKKDTKTKAKETKSRKQEPGAQATGEAKEEAPKFDLPDDPKALKEMFERELATLRDMQGKDPLVPVEVTSEVVAKVIGDWTGIPVGNMVKDQAAQLLTMEDELKKRVKGQDHVMTAIATGVRAAKAGLGNPEAPMGVFLFVGPSGTGKTETALAVADLLFGGERFMTAVNMSEFQEKHTVSRLIGSPPGYVGYGEGGQLTEAVRQRPYSVVLLDEVEKADLDVMNLFYQVFDKGVLNDGEGREVDFKNTVMFLTSNLATDIITEACSDGDRPDMTELVSLIRPALSAHFKPALLARMTILPFYTIDTAAMKMITELKLNKIVKRMQATHGMELKFEPAVVAAIADRCKEVETGARNIDHIIRGNLLPQMSTQLLQKMSTGELPSKMAVGISESGDFSFGFST